MSAFPLLAVLADPETPLSDFLGAIGNTLHWLLALPVQASVFARQVDALQYIEFATFALLGTITLGAVFLFVVRYRRRPGDPVAPRTRRIVSPTWLELGVAGSLLGMFMIWWIFGFRQYASRQDPPPDALTVYAIGKQWVWKFSYPDGPQSNSVLYLPEDRPVRVLTTSRDVIHSFFVPAFRIKEDAVPGRYNTTWFRPTRIGRFRIQCAEFCGAGHSRMEAQAVVLPPADFDRWLEGYDPEGDEATTVPPGILSGRDERTPVEETMAGRGRRVAAEKGCLRCHTTDGKRHIAPTWLGLYGSRVPLESGDTVLADPGYLTMSMMDPGAMVVKGFPDVMPAFQGRLTQAEAAALVEYIKSIRRTP